MLDLIAALLIRPLNLVFHLTPIRFNLFLARRMGEIAYIASPKRNRFLYANLKAAFYNEKTPRELKEIAKAVYRNLAQVFMEILCMTKINARYKKKFIEDNMEEILRTTRATGAKIFLSAHFGNWEMAPVVSAINGYPVYLLARDQKMPRLNDLLNRMRSSKGSLIVKKGMDLKNIFSILRDGKNIGMLGDQNVRKGAEFVPFFSRVVPMAAGPFRFAQKTGALIFPSFIHRVKGPRHKLVLEAPIIIKEDEPITSHMKRYNDLLEEHIRQQPDQWLWMYKRWKRTPLKKVMVLDDGNEDNLERSLAAVERFRLMRIEKGFTYERITYEVIRVRFKNKVVKLLFKAASLFFNSRCRGCVKCLRWSLDRDSCDALVKNYGDYVTSRADDLFGVNKLLRIENNAKAL